MANGGGVGNSFNDSVADKMENISTMRSFASKVRSMEKPVTHKQLNDMLPDYVSGSDIRMVLNNDSMAKGGSIYADLSEKEFANKIFGANVFTENISEYFDVKKLSSSNDNKVEKFISDLKADGYYVKKNAYSDFTSVIGVKKKH